MTFFIQASGIVKLLVQFVGNLLRYEMSYIPAMTGYVLDKAGGNELTAI